MPRTLAAVGLISILALVGGPRTALPSSGRETTSSQPVTTPIATATPSPRPTSNLGSVKLYLPALANRAPTKPVANPQFTLDAQLARPCLAVTSDGTLGYLAEGRQVRVIDPHAPSPSRQLVGTSPILGGAVRGLAVSDGYLFAALGDAGLSILDVHLPSQPKLIASVTVPDLALAVAVNGGMAYVAAGDTGLQIIDVHEPDRPRLVDSVYIDGWSHNVLVAGGRVFVGVDRGFQTREHVMGVAIVDERDPQNARVEAFVQGEESDAILTVEGPPMIDFAVSAGFLFLPSGPSGPGLAVVDVRDPARPVNRATVYECGSSPACREFGPVSVGRLAVHDHYLYASAGYYGDLEGIRVFDIANPVEPVFVGGVVIAKDHFEERVADLANVGTTILAATMRNVGQRDDILNFPSGALRIVDAGVAMLPTLEPAYAPAMSYGHMAIAGARAYAMTAGFNGPDPAFRDAIREFHVLGLSRPPGLVDLGTVAGISGVVHVVAGDGWAAGVVVAHGQQQTLIFDPAGADPLEPIATIDTQDAWPGTPDPKSGAVGRLAADGHRLFVPAKGGVRIYDLADLRSPRLVATAPVTGSLEAIGGGLGLFADLDMGSGRGRVTGRWRVVDMTDAPSVRVLGSFEATVEVPASIVTNGKAAYLADRGGEELHTIDLTDPSQPQFLASLPLGYFLPSLVLDGAHLYVSGYSGSSGVLVRAFDLTNRNQPREIASTAGPQAWDWRRSMLFAYGLAARDGLVLLGSGDYDMSSGLAAYRLDR